MNVALQPIQSRFQMARGLFYYPRMCRVLTRLSEIQFPALNPLFYFCDIILLLLLLFMCLYVHNLLESCLWEDNPTGGRMPFQAGFQSQLPRVPLLPYCCSAFLVFLFLFSLLRQVSNEHPKKLCHLKVP